jgi:hypothetical protein
MTPLRSLLCLVLLLAGCAGEELPSDAPAPWRRASQALVAEQGQQLQGQQLQGQQLQGQQMQDSELIPGARQAEEVYAHRLAGWVLAGTALENARIERGELVAERRVPETGLRETLRGTQLTGALLVGDNGAGGTVRYRLAEVRPELAAHDALGTGGTFLYTVEWQTGNGSWLPLCGSDTDGLRAALPLAAVFDATGARHESTTHFTFGCTTGVLAKCYRWGYKPWLSHPAEPTLMRDLHWACTRMARADYCGNGRSHTRDGTLINLWDTLPAPGPLQSRGEPVPGFLFEAGWSTSGAVCLSKTRWLELSPEVAAACPERLIPPGASVGPATVCDAPAQALAFDPKARLFNESKLNLLP